MRKNQVETNLSVKQKLGILCLGLVCALSALIAFWPANWLGTYLQSGTNGHIALIDAEGSLWNGSARIGVAPDKYSDLTPIVPGRFFWHLSPIMLLGQIELVVENPDSLHNPLYITGNFQHIQISPDSLVLPAERLAGLGAPLNTVKPSGEMLLSWDALGVTLDNGFLDINGTMKLTLQDIGSALSPIRPLGSYAIDFVWRGPAANIVLKTTQGPLILKGNGKLVHGHLQFSGTAQAQEAQEEDLANLLNLLGQHRPGADKNVIALEIK